MNKHCSKCASSTGTLYPHCTQYDKPIKIDADWHLTPVNECLANQEMIDLRKQHDAEKFRKMLREQTSSKLPRNLGLQAGEVEGDRTAVGF